MPGFWTRFAIAILLIGSFCQPGQAQPPQADLPDAGAKWRSIDESLLFFPSKYPEGNWNPKDLRFEDVFFTADDKTKLHGWYCPCDHPRGVLLIAHGNAGNVASRAAWLRYLQSKLKLSVFIFDYRGYGRSEGAPNGRRRDQGCDGGPRETLRACESEGFRIAVDGRIARRCHRRSTGGRYGSARVDFAEYVFVASPRCGCPLSEAFLAGPAEQA